jgi:adenosylcobinamide amidohydrolase
VLSWAIVGGGFGRTRTIAIHEVKNTELPRDVDPVALLETRLAERGESSAVGLLTSRDLAHIHVRTARFEGAEATALVTAGLSNALAVGDEPGPSSFPGTINVVCRVGVPLSPHGLVEALSIAVEARTAAVLAAKVPSRRSGARATGTGTDCVVIASPIADHEVAYAGKHTALGHVVGRAVLEATSDAIARWKETVSA